MELYGYLRPNGRIGFRNNVIIIPLVGCVGDVGRRMAAQVAPLSTTSAPNAVAIVHPHGCELDGFDSDYLALQMERLVTHANVGGVVFVTMGCGATNRFKLAEKASDAGKLVETINFHVTGGTNRTVSAGAEAVRQLVRRLSTEERQPVEPSALVLGTKCGSSDRTSFDVLHGVTGIVCDRIVDEGGTVVLAEDYELAPDIERLSQRAVDENVKREVLGIREDLIGRYRQRFGRDLEWGEDAREASFKHAAKAGSRPIQRVIPLEGMVEGPGLVLHNGPNSDLVSVTSLAVAGCNMLLFTTGRGTPVGGPLPTVKVTANRRTEEHMEENIDVGVADVTEERIDAEEGAERIYDAIVQCANGKPSKAELLGHVEMQFHIKGVLY